MCNNKFSSSHERSNYSDSCGCGCNDYSNDCECDSDYSDDSCCECECECECDGCGKHHKIIEIYKIPFPSHPVLPPNSTVQNQDSGFITDYKHDTNYEIDVEPRYFRTTVDSSVINMANEQITFINVYGSYVFQYSYKLKSGKKGDIVARGKVYGATGKFEKLNGTFEVIKGLNNVKIIATFDK
jgi:hypothetical protein